MMYVDASGGRKVSPRKVRFRPSPLPITLSHGIACQLEVKNPSRCTMWSSCSTALTPLRAAKDVTGVSVITGNPSRSSYPRHLNNQRSES